MSSDKAITDRVRCGQYELQVVMSSSPPADENVQRVILVVHGRERNADEMFSQASSANPDSSSSLIVAPQFYNGLDKEEYHRDPRGTDKLLVWKGNNWGEGGASQYPRNSEISSFEVLDTLVQHYGRLDRSPRLQHLAIIGHSMGGQLVQRYSVLGQPSSQVPLSYIVMNSSTFMYLNNEEYKYGLRDIDQTLSCYRPTFVDINELQYRIRSRLVHYLQGALDKGVGDERDVAMKQGKDRHERFSNWKAYLDLNHLSSLATFDVISNASHDAGQMIASQIGVQYIFREGCQ